jgi:hypothetical protein
VLSKIATTIKLRPLRRVLVNNNIEFSANDSLSKLRRDLKKYITILKHGKMTELNLATQRASELQREREKKKINESWPQRISVELKDKIVKMFRQQTSKSVLSSFTCSVCAESTLCAKQHEIQASDIDLELHW